ncbi:MAG: hypothetical protein WBP42_02580 [Candidatus Zixiibacteriota bacterium]
MSKVNPIDALSKIANDVGVEFNPEGAITKSVVTSDLLTGSLSPEQRLEMIDMIKQKSSVLAAIQVIPVAGPSGDAPVMDWTQRAVFPAKENKGYEKTTSPEFTERPYKTAGVRSDLAITRQMIRQFKANGITDVTEMIKQRWATVVSNDMADNLINGDELLAAAPANDIEYSRSVNDGILKLTNTGTQLYDALSTPLNKKFFAKLRELMDEDFSGDDATRWICNPAVIDKWQEEIGYVNTSSSYAGLTAEALTLRGITSPFSIPFMRIPQISTKSGPNALSDAASAQSGFTRVRCDTAFGGYNAAHAGRRVKVVYIPTGQTRTGRVSDVSSHLEFDTTDFYGLGAANTTSTNYRVYVADETSIIHCNPLNFGLCISDDWRNYSEFESNYERIWFRNFFDYDVILVIPKAVAKITRIRLPEVSLT